jgi:hypothetical protein
MDPRSVPLPDHHAAFGDLDHFACDIVVRGGEAR